MKPSVVLRLSAIFSLKIVQEVVKFQVYILSKCLTIIGSCLYLWNLIEDNHQIMQVKKKNKNQCKYNKDPPIVQVHNGEYAHTYGVLKGSNIATCIFDILYV